MKLYRLLKKSGILEKNVLRHKLRKWKNRFEEHKWTSRNTKPKAFPQLSEHLLTFLPTLLHLVHTPVLLLMLWMKWWLKGVRKLLLKKIRFFRALWNKDQYKKETGYREEIFSHILIKRNWVGWHGSGNRNHSLFVGQLPREFCLPIKMLMGH